MKSQRVGLYARISTENNGQDPETQLIALREYASHRGMTVTDE
jgi:DNA invertase Pin-like site-specific DNA recombinase